MEVATVWADDLRDVSLAVAVEAARDHYRQSTAWLMPGHIIAGVRRIRERETPVVPQIEAAPFDRDQALRAFVEGSGGDWDRFMALRADGVGMFTALDECGA